jgi:hypothetical protein
MPKVIGLDWDEATAFDVQNKGWYEQAQLQKDDGTLVSLSFWDPVRLRQELEADFASGRKYFAERNLIILPKLTEDAIRMSVDELLTKGFF